jgi:hypothetical protein
MPKQLRKKLCPQDIIRTFSKANKRKNATGYHQSKNKNKNPIPSLHPPQTQSSLPHALTTTPSYLNNALYIARPPFPFCA